MDPVDFIPNYQPPKIHKSPVDTRIEPRQLAEPAGFTALLASSAEAALQALAKFASPYESKLSKRSSKTPQSRITTDLAAEITNNRDRLTVFLADQSRYPWLFADEDDGDGKELEKLGQECLALMDRVLVYIRKGWFRLAVASLGVEDDTRRALMADLEKFHEMVQSHVAAQEARYVQADCTPVGLISHSITYS